MKVAAIERNAFGGTCVNTGCIPTKTMVASAYAAHMAARAAEYGVDVGSVRVDMKRVMARKEAVSKESRTDLEDWLRNMENCHRSEVGQDRRHEFGDGRMNAHRRRITVHGAFAYFTSRIGLATPEPGRHSRVAPGRLLN